jgi:hypothetical protein
MTQKYKRFRCVWSLLVLSLHIICLLCHFPQELNELKDQIQDVEGKYMQGLKEMKVSVCKSVACDTNPPHH